VSQLPARAARSIGVVGVRRLPGRRQMGRTALAADAVVSA
jgi:hypothetical protein